MATLAPDTCQVSTLFFPVTIVFTFVLNFLLLKRTMTKTTWEVCLAFEIFCQPVLSRGEVKAQVSNDGVKSQSDVSHR